MRAPKYIASLRVRLAAALAAYEISDDGAAPLDDATLDEILATPASERGDSLLDYLIADLTDASGHEEAADRLDTAITQLVAARQAILALAAEAA